MVNDQWPPQRLRNGLEGGIKTGSFRRVPSKRIYCSRRRLRIWLDCGVSIHHAPLPLRSAEQISQILLRKA
ncbi:hypothetical protein BCR33DRAFT_718912 [Rhizoclosmatium globosum]|uniref:Uncharacterized protein n=1 Tax=Rhizoclosmatium globosum TaxID=329046 RepID=A0A1Y2C303_9FUNG|nr:hypothetical protein BCR33DRAFT_718912 [Rhizoclosmatium globosum]|eukprot:ORY41267.1 hypothetical protein BCR33DRAFT_718912 [Rhizoclosmatium globosum]